MTSGNPRVRCTATAKSTGKRCGNAPVRGAAICRYHGANRAVRAAGQRRIAMANVVLHLQRAEKERAKEQAIVAAARSPWAHEEWLWSPAVRHWSDPKDLRRIAKHMRQMASLVDHEAAAIERELKAHRKSGRTATGRKAHESEECALAQRRIDPPR